MQIVHPSASYRRGLAAALDPAEFSVTERAGSNPSEANGFATVVVVADGSELSVLSNREADATVVVLMSDLNVDRYRRVLAAGADGVAHVDSQPSTIADIVKSAVSGEIVLPAEVARQLAGRPRPATVALTAEERRLLQRLSEGATVMQLADEFFMAERSVRRRLQNVYLRLGVGGRAEALKLASQLGFVD